MKHLQPFFRNAKLDDITRADVHRYITHRLKAGAKKATINRELACLKRLFNVAIEWEKLAVNPMYRMKLLKEEERPVRSLTLDEEDRLLAYCRTSAHPVYRVMAPIIVGALNTGMRQSEILNLRWDQVDFSSGTITLDKTKAKKVRLVPMNALVTETLLPLNRGSKFVFPIDREGDVRSKFKHHWFELMKKVELPKFRFHDLRATFATRLDAKGVGAFTIKSLLGHSTMEVTKRYIGVNDSSRRAVEALIRHEIRHEEKTRH